MKLALNYSREAAALLDSGLIDFDLYKCPDRTDWDDWRQQALRQKPYYVHFDLSSGRRMIPDVDFHQLDRLKAESGTRYVNLHLDSMAEIFSPDTPDSRDPQQVERALQAMLDDVQIVVDRFGPRNVIVENLPYPLNAGVFMLPAVEPASIQRIVGQTGCGFLLDVSHAVITCRNLGWDLWEYLEALPVDRIREMHITGVQMVNGSWCDHLGLTPEDWHVFEKVVERIHSGAWSEPEYVAFEYGGIGPIFEWRSDPQVIQEQVPRLWSMLK